MNQEVRTNEAVAVVAETVPAKPVKMAFKARIMASVMAVMSVLLAFGVSAEEPAAAASTQLSSVITQQMLAGVVSEIVGVLPTVVPAVIGILALRKGISFVMGMIRGA